MAKAKNTHGKASARDYQILVKPMVTEKSSLVGEAGNCVVFEVHPKATKTEIRSAVERIFDVDVAGVRTCNYRGKLKRTMRAVGRTAGYRKAYVTLQEGQSIDIVEGV